MDREPSTVDRVAVNRRLSTVSRPMHRLHQTDTSFTGELGGLLEYGCFALE